MPFKKVSKPNKGVFKKGHPFLPHKPLEEGPREAVEPPALRSRSAVEPEAEGGNENDEYMLLHIGQLEGLINIAFREHSALKCVKIDFKIKKHKAQLISQRLSLGCQSCGYTSKISRMFQTLPDKTGKTGPKQSTLNLALGASILDSSLGASGTCEFFRNIGVPLSEKGAQRQINSVAPILEEVAEESMHHHREKYSGKKIAIAVDTAYNNRNNPNTPYQAGTQAITTVTEDETPGKKILAVITDSKVCPNGQRLRTMGVDVSCPSTSHNCTATLKVGEPIGNEGRYSRKAGEVLRQDNISVHTVISDGDSKIKYGFEEGLGHSSENVKCNRHHSRNVEKMAKKTEFSQQIFQKSKIKLSKSQLKSRFASSLRKRCDAELKLAKKKIQESNRNSSPEYLKKEMTASLQNTPKAILSCYKGNCTLCDKFSYACSVDSNNRYWHKDALPEGLRKKIDPTPEDEKLILNLISKKMSTQAISQIYRLSDTNKNESINRAYLKRNPKTSTHTRTKRARICRTVLDLNEGHAQAASLVRLKTSHLVCPRVKRQIHGCDNNKEQKKRQRKTTESKKKRAEKISFKFKQYDDAKTLPADGYQTGIYIIYKCITINLSHYIITYYCFSSMSNLKNSIE